MRAFASIRCAIDPLESQHRGLQRPSMNLHLYRKRKLANRPESAQQKPYACSKCHKTFAYMESVKCHAKQSPGCHYADYIVLDPIAPAQPSTSHSHHVMQPHSELMCHSGLGNGLDPAPIESPGLLECCEPAGLARRRPSAHHHAPLQLSQNNTQVSADVSAPDDEAHDWQYAPRLARLAASLACQGGLLLELGGH